MLLKLTQKVTQKALKLWKSSKQQLYSWICNVGVCGDGDALWRCTKHLLDVSHTTCNRTQKHWQITVARHFLAGCGIQQFFVRDFTATAPNSINSRKTTPFWMTPTILENWKLLSMIHSTREIGAFARRNHPPEHSGSLQPIWTISPNCSNYK